MKYPIAETFFSLKGEGLHTGVPMYFIRFSECNLNCAFCDTDFSKKKEMSEDELTIEALESGAKHVVLTGGEPCLQRLFPLIEALHRENFQVHMETNGSILVPQNIDWITVSPKNLSLNFETVRGADEIKFLCGSEGWRELIEGVLKKYEPVCRLLLMPLAIGKRDGNWSRKESDFIESNLKETIDYCKAHPEFTFCIQLHKVLNIK